jgi:hypothetical protein
MESSSQPAAEFPPPIRVLNEPKTVKAILGFVGAFLVMVGAYLLGTAEGQLNMEIERSIEMPLAEFRQLPEDVWSVVETERQNVLLKRRAAFGSILAAGVILTLFALLVKRRLLSMIVAGLIVVIIAAAAFGLLSRKKRDVAEGGALETTGDEMKVEKIVVWVSVGFALVSLAWGAKIGFAYRRRMQAIVGPPGATIDNP